MSSRKEEYSNINMGSLGDKKVVCLTLDVEQDYGDLLDEPSYEGLEHIPEVVAFFREKNIPLTCFVQGSLLETHPAFIEQMSTLDIEFELHSYSHPSPKKRNIEFEVGKGKEAYREFFGEDPLGYRAPLGVIDGRDYEILASHGFKFDSSISPSIRPGTFNNMAKPTKICLVNKFKIIEFPFTVFHSMIRIPLAISYIKLLGRPFFYLLKILPLPNLIIFGFHLHDLFGLSSANKLSLEKFSPVYRLVFSRIYIRQSNDGLAILDEIVALFQERGYVFCRIDDIYKSIANTIR